MSKQVQQLDRVIIRFAGDSGDGMQLTGDRFTAETASFGNDLSTLPNFPAEIRAPAGTLPGVSSFQLHFADHDILTPGDAPNVLVAMNPAALKANLADLPLAAPPMPGMINDLMAQPPLARGTVRYVGEPLAVVVGEDPYACEDAAELVEMDFSPRAVVLDARTPHALLAAELVRGYGDVETAFSQARRVVTIELAIGRHSAVPLETRGALARYDAARDVLELYGATKVPHRNRDALARMLGRSTAAMVLKEGNTGGGFYTQGGQFYYVRGLGLVKTTEDIGEVVVASFNGAPVRIKDIGHVAIGYAPRLGIFGFQDKQKNNDDAVEGVILMRRGEQTQNVL